MRSPRMMIVAAVGLVALVGAAVPYLTATAEEERGTYLVRLADPPLAGYRGGIDGLAATSPTPDPDTGSGIRLDVDSDASVAYLKHLAKQQDALRETIAAALDRSVKPLFRYRYAYNGMALSLTGEEAGAVRRLPGVASVNPAYQREVRTDVAPEWIGAGEVWSGDATGGLPGTRGEGVVIGVVDSGVNHDHPSFADVGGDGYDHDNPRGRFYGLCRPAGGLFCNDKLIGVYDFTRTGPQDDSGHGSHTASTAAGNVVDATLRAPTTDVTRRISGVAPHANLITYKSCLGDGTCPSDALVAAIDQAVADGVEVINYSIGGGPGNPWEDDDSVAFLGARQAGVFVAGSAGNAGPDAGTTGSPGNAPWLLSVGATNHSRTFVSGLADLDGGSGTAPADLAGRGFTDRYGPAPIVYAGDHGDALCGSEFEPGTFHGEIVVCDRGENARMEKGKNVKAGGAGGMVLANTRADGESTVADPQELPAVNLGYAASMRLKDWLGQGTGHIGTIAGTRISELASAGDVLAGFSARGPNGSVPGVLKPDVVAPGVDVLAAVNTTKPGQPAEYGLRTGTSMASPLAAGAAALLHAVHPDWTPAQVQSALTTTGVTRVRDAAGPFGRGGGRIELRRAALAGLLLDVPPGDFVAAEPASGGDPTTLNLATMAQPDCPARCTFRRTFSNALQTTATWRVDTRVPEGLALSVEPSRFTLAPGESVTVTVTAEVSGGRSWVTGAVRLASPDAPTQRLPVAVRPGTVSRPAGIQADGATWRYNLSHARVVTSTAAGLCRS